MATAFDVPGGLLQVAIEHQARTGGSWDFLQVGEAGVTPLLFDLIIGVTGINPHHPDLLRPSRAWPLVS